MAPNPISSSTTSACHDPPTTKRPPSPEETSSAAAAYLDDEERDKVFLHVWFSFMVFAMFCGSAANTWQYVGHWQDVVIAAIVFLYLAVILNLLLVKRRDNRRREIEACDKVILRGTEPELMSSLMLVATGIMVVSLGIAAFIFRHDRLDLGFLAFSIFLSVVSICFLLKIDEVARKKRLREKCQVVSDLV